MLKPKPTLVHAILPKSFRTRLLLSFALVITMLLSIGVMAFHFGEKIIQLSKASDELAKTQVELYDLFTRDQHFIDHNNLNYYFYSTGNSRYLDHRQAIKEMLREQLEVIDQLAREEQWRPMNIQALENTLNKYHEAFEKIIEYQLERGFKDYGLEGKMRGYIHALLDQSNAFAQADLLMLRRHEKDFFLRFDQYYILELNKLCDELVSASQGNPMNAKESALIEAYRTTFNEIADIDLRLGRSYNQGLKKDLFDLKQNSNVLMRNMASHMHSNVGIEQTRALNLILLVTLVGSVLTVIMVYFVVQFLSKPIEQLSWHFDLQRRHTVSKKTNNYHTLPVELKHVVRSAKRNSGSNRAIHSNKNAG